MEHEYCYYRYNERGLLGLEEASCKFPRVDVGLRFPRMWMLGSGWIERKRIFMDGSLAV